MPLPLVVQEGSNAQFLWLNTATAPTSQTVQDAVSATCGGQQRVLGARGASRAARAAPAYHVERMSCTNKTARRHVLLLVARAGLGAGKEACHAPALHDVDDVMPR